MSLFEIDAEKLQWINGESEDQDDLCLHGEAVCKIGEEIFVYNATVSATALYLLKTLTEDHIIYQENQMLPCCGHCMVPNDELTKVDILGCCNGIDWSVLHEGDKIKMITEKENVIVMDLEEYRKKVFAFADKIENFYNSCKPKNLPNEFEKNCYIAFWNEWHRRRGRQNFPLLYHK